jgi:protein TBF1
MLLVVSQDLNNGLLQKISDFTTDHAHSFRNLQQAFEATRRLYSGGSILALDDGNAADADFRSIFLLANLAQLAVWVVDDTTDSLREAEKNVLSMLGNETADIPDKISDVYVTLKSRLAVESLLAKEPNKTSEDVIRDWFPDDLDTMLRQQRHGQDPSPLDQVLVSSLQLRGEHLKTVATGNGDLCKSIAKTLPSTFRGADHKIVLEKNKYNSDVLLRDLASYIRSRLASANELGKKLGVSMPPAEEPTEPEMFVAEDTEVAGLDLEDLSSFFEKTTSGLVQSALAEFGEETAEAEPVAQGGSEAPVVTTESVAEGAMKPAVAPAPSTNFITDYKELEALVAESTSNYVKTTLNGLSPTPYQPTVPTSTGTSPTTLVLCCVNC